MNKKSICKWESTCDDDCRRPYGNCPENCQNYKPYVSIEQLEKENAELKKDKEYLDKVNNEQTKVILELQAQIEKMKNCANCKHCDCKTKKEIKICGKCTLDKLLWSQWELAE